MNRRLSAFFAFTWPVIFFLTVLGAVVLFAGPACGGDDLAALTKALEAQNAAKPAGCTCPECNCWTGEDCGADCAFGGKKPKEGACPGCLAARKAAGEPRCGCGNPGVCSARGCGGTQPCDDESCPRAAAKHPQDCGCLGGKRCTCGQACGCTKAPFQGDLPRLGDRKVTNDPSRPFVYGWGDAYGYGHVLGYYRPAVAAPVTYYAPPPAYFQQAAPRFFGGGGGSCGPSG